MSAPQEENNISSNCGINSNVLIGRLDMVKYTFILKIKGFNSEVKYILDLQPLQENNPEQFFNPELCEKIRANLQMQSLYRINDIDLKQLINIWIQDIKEGYRDSTIILNLPLLIESNIDKLDEQGNQELPTLISPQMTDVEPQIGALPPLSFC